MWLQNKTDAARERSQSILYIAVVCLCLGCAYCHLAMAFNQLLAATMVVAALTGITSVGEMQIQQL